MRLDPLKTRASIAAATLAGALLLLGGLLLCWKPAPREGLHRPPPAARAAAVTPVLVAVPTPADEPRETGGGLPAASAPAVAGGPSPTPGTAGLVVGIDPETGKLGMPSSEFRARAAQSPALDRSMTGLTVVTRPDGSKHLDLKGRFQEYTVIRLAPDGRQEETCVQGPDVDAALRGGAKTPPQPPSQSEVR